MAVSYPVIEGFDNYTSVTDMMTRQGDVSWVTAYIHDFEAGPYGGQALYCATPGSTAIMVLATPVSTIYNGLRMNLSNVTTNNVDGAQIVVGDGQTSGGGLFGTTGWQFLINLNPTLGQISVLTGMGSWWSFITGGGTPVYHSSNGLFPKNSWFFFEWEVILNGASSSFTAWVNNVQVAAASGLSLDPSGTGTAGIFSYGDVVFQPGNFLIDDMYWNTSSGSPYPGRLQDGQALVYYPTGDSSVAWTSSTSNPNYQNVNSRTQTTVNNNSQTPGAIDLFAVGGVPNGTVKAVSVKGYSNKNNAASRQMSWLLKSGSATSTGPAFGLNSSASVTSYQVNADPNTTAAWTVANLNAALIGYEEQV